ncbi:MAG TPA: lipase family protein [Povalibacter sp.]|uniref:lipase family protein n=1 Tax=Povalibacter sp. TaxID=1962978 RepID=UPI002CD29BB0|nr:lipase family protein [Povalibacter sp.]HMN44568.1 lipase family protein [Povalibacter sp.]
MRYRHCGLILLLALQGCASSSQRIDAQAEAAGLSRSVVAGRDFRHVVYANALAHGDAAAQRLVVYFDGDGRPWGSSGLQPAADPTTRKPLALQLLARTPAPGIYVSRPCYQELKDPACEAAVWTSERYSTAVVDSLVAAIGQFSAARPPREIVLIGYSGGGVLATLAAERLGNVAAVVTIAANLDIDAWAQYHGYLPLTGSLNPAASGHDHAWREVHLQGADDAVVPAATTARYFARYPAAQQRQFDGFSHVCCWVERWAEIFADVAL